MPNNGSGASTKDRVVKDRARGKKPVGTMPRTSPVMPEEHNTACG